MRAWRRRALAAVLAWLVRLWLASLRVERRGPPLLGPGVAAFWHGDQLPLLAIRPAGAVAPISRSADGRLQALVMARLGIAEVSGSSSRGGAQAARALLRAVRAGGIAVIAADGPRGPARQAKPGAGWLAGAAGAPLWPVAVAGRGPRLRSWDRFFLPWPFSRVVIVVGPALPDAAPDPARVTRAVEAAREAATRWLADPGAAGPGAIPFDSQ